MKPKLLTPVCLLLVLFATGFSLELTKEFAEATRKTLAEQHATWLRQQNTKKSGETIEPGLKIVNDDVQQSSDANCSPGFTGPNCNNPICSQKIPIRAHDGLNGMGEAIELATSYECSDNLTVSVDNYVVDLIISIYSISATGKPLMSLFRPDGSELLPDDASADQDDLYQARFARIVSTSGPGLYTVRISSIDISPCSYQFTAATNVVFDGGFATDVRSDAVQVDVYTPWKLLQNPMVNVPSFLAAQPSGVSWPGSVQTVSFFNGDVLQYPPQDLKARYNCSASLGSISPYVCIRSDFFKVKFNGIDDQGLPFQRTYTFSCGTNSSGEIPTTAPPPTACYNGGTLVNFGPTNSTCICSVYFEGNQCETKRCYNGGFLNDEGDCRCAPGYSGNFCQDLNCKVPYHGNFGLEGRALVFAVRTTTSMQEMITTAYNTARQIIGFANANNPGYYRAYVLVGFANNSLTFNQEFTDADSFTTAIQNLKAIDSSMTNCSDSVYGALSTAVTSESVRTYKRSPIFLFTDVLPNDPEDRPALFASLADFEGQIFSVLHYSSASMCPINIHDLEYRELRRLAQFTHGLVTYLPASNVTDTVFNLAISVEATVSLAMNDFVDQCSLGSKYTTFFVDDSTGQVNIIATGNALTITLFNTKTQTVTPRSTKNVGNTYIYVFDTLVKGNYLLQIGADVNSPCQFRILGDSAYELFVGTALSINTDLSTTAPQYNQLTNIVARVNQVGFRNPSEVYAEVIVWSNDFFTGNRTLVYAGNGFYRDHCDFHFYFEKFKCARRNSLFYISVFVTDPIGYTVQRVRSSYCAVPQVVPTSPDGCQNGGAVDKNSPNSTCLCPNGWTGDKCQIIVCLNNGVSMTDHCQCRSGYTGTFCEIPRCSSTSNEDFSPFRRSITFLVHDSRTTATMIQKMQAQMAQTIQDVSQQHPLWINQYTLVTFDDSTMQQRISTPDAAAFITAFSSFAAENSQNSKATCTNLQVLQALFNLMMSSSTETYGLYYVFMRGIMSFDAQIFNEVQLLLETTQSQVNFVETDTYPCNSPLTATGPQLMWTIAGMTGGQVYIVSLPNAAGAMKTIPLQFRNGLIYEKYVADCTGSDGVNFYFPIDSETQSVSVLFSADLAKDPIYMYPNGSTDQYIVNNIYTDYGVSTRLDQIISPCDGYYRPLENRCWTFSGNIATWEEAQAACAKDNAILATVFDSKVEAYLYSKSGPTATFWVGLNDKSQNGNWVWDQGSATALPLSSTNFLNWGTNQPNTAAGQCVYDSQNSKWTVDNCSNKRPFACVKHAYNVDYSPNSASDNKIFQGIWNVNVQSYTGGCSVSVFGQSGIQVYPMYTNDLKSDYGYRTPVYGNYTQYIASHVTGLTSFTGQDSGALQYAHFYSGNSNLTMTQVAKYTQRDYDTCQHQFVSDAFNCPGLGSTIMHTGVDRFGYAFQRIVPTLCYNMANTTCVNGGVYYNNKCVCPPNWGGAMCQMPFCAHGKLANNFITCNCANTGFTGTFCQIPVCVNGTAAAPTETNQNKTLAIVLDGSFTNGMDGVLNNLQGVLTQIVTNGSQIYPGWYNNFIGVVAFDSQRNGSIISGTIHDTDPNNFVTSLVNVVQSTQYKSPQSGRALFSAISAACSGAQLQERSLVYVISAGNAEDYNMYDQVLDLISFTHPAIHMIFVGDQNAPGNASYRDPSVDYLHELSFVSGGGFYQVSNYTQLQYFWWVQLSTVHNSYTVAYDTYHDCSNHSMYIQIAASNTKLIFDLFTMVPVKLTIIDSQNNVYLVQNMVATRTNYLFYLNGSPVFQPGIYTVNFQSSNATNHPICNLGVRSLSAQTVYPAFTQDTGYDNGQHSNTANLAPTQPPTRNAVVVAANFGVVQFAQAYDLNEKTLLWASPMVARQNCVYGFSSKEAFICPAPSFALAIDGVDDNGHPYRRVQITHCKGFRHNSTNSLAESPVSFTHLMAKLE